MKQIYKYIVLAVLVYVLVVTSINPIYPEEQSLQHIGTFLLGLILCLDLKKRFLMPASFIGVTFFTLIHIIGARYIYSYVPYNEWSKELFGFDVNEYFETTRNHYDRFVHFSFGLVMIPICLQFAEKMKIPSKLTCLLVAWLMIQTGSMIYELFEWSLTIIMSPQSAENYNGQQGDMWDAQKDMALALLGSIISSILYFVLKGKRK